MSRLDSMMRRLAAQRDGIEWGLARIGGIDGDILDMGLGNGRTYDHLREHAGGRRIRVIDRVLQCHPSCVPPQEDFLEGEADAMLDRLAAEGARIALVHYDLGFGVKDRDVAEAARLSPRIARIMMPGGILVSGQPLEGFDPLPGPDTVAPDRYCFYRHAG
ncbi:S-adenosyl-L-methionine methyltransferase [Salinihabitans flavidus]|uniref:S-adenosyl-L-methionine methyltransferase n=1 Tax=Salinihabitans flavidus TaxID=569882 RepID=A0A1H8MTU1_9RHOB|nr:class I SAM-dependent methyltransferase [Salinihabitans flavidus]SEO20767.1 S-adenosyl-L-methionine methyltransferase [Salinihabitans flavidus]